jgi:hypothetical protein
MPKQDLDGAEVCPRIEQVCGERMAPDVPPIACKPSTHAGMWPVDVQAITEPPRIETAFVLSS